MQTKTELALLRSKLLQAINLQFEFEDKPSNLTYKPPTLKTIQSDGNTLSSNNIWENGSILLDNKIIAQISVIYVVERICFWGRYDTLIKEIFKWLDVELHRFGSSWIGYPSEEPLRISNVDMELAFASRPIRIPVNDPYSPFYTASTSSTSSTLSFSTTASTTSYTPIMASYEPYTANRAVLMRTFGDLLEDKVNYIGNYTGNYTGNKSIRRKTGATITPVGNPARDPRIRTAQEVGLTQRQIDQLGNKGRR